MLPLYPQFSSATTESSIADFANIFKKNKHLFKEKLKTKVVCCYPTQSDFIKSHSILIKKAFAKHYKDNLADFRFLFSAHGLPQKVIDKGDPYVFQVSQTIEGVVSALSSSLKVKEGEIDSQICFQSKVGPLKWTSPSLDQELKRAALDDKIPVIIPIAFVSEHSETLVELDIEYKEKAEKLGITKYVRVPALNSDGHFIKSLVEICKMVDKNKDHNIFSGCLPDRICPKKMRLCPNSNSCSNDNL
jgi:ferrochelatase